jgi:AraC-like DNA-binding protein
MSSAASRPTPRESAARPRYSEFQLAGCERDVAAFWRFDADGEPLRILPDGCIDFIFDLDAGTAVATGSMTESQLLQPPSGERSFGVRFAPGAAAVLLDARAAELTNARAALADVSRAGALRLAERIADASSDAARARVVRDYMNNAAARLRAREPRVRRASELLAHSEGRASIAAIADAVALSERQLERLFAEHVGIRPKLLARVLRMQRALARLSEQPAAQAEQAHDAGYADQPHLIREFRTLTGVTPHRLLLERRVGIVQAEAACSR